MPARRLVEHPPTGPPVPSRVHEAGGMVSSGGKLGGMNDKNLVIVCTDGDADYTVVYGPFSQDEVEKVDLPEDDGDYFWRVGSLNSLDQLRRDIDGDEDVTV